MPGAPPPPKPPRPGAPPRAGAPPRPPGPPGHRDHRGPTAAGTTWAATAARGVAEGSRGLRHHRRVGSRHSVAAALRAGWALVAATGTRCRRATGGRRGPAAHALRRGERVVARARGAGAGRARAGLEAGACARSRFGSLVAAVGARLSGRLGRSVVLRLGGRLRGLGVRLRRSLDDLAGTGSRLEEGLGPLLGDSRLGGRRGRLRGGGVDRYLGRGSGSLLRGRLLGSLLRRLLLRLGGEIGAVLVLEPLHDGRFDGRAGCFDELTEIAQHRQDVLRRDVVLLGEFMDSDLGHVFPPGPNPCSIRELRTAS